MVDELDTCGAHVSDRTTRAAARMSVERWGNSEMECSATRAVENNAEDDGGMERRRSARDVEVWDDVTCLRKIVKGV